MGNCLTCDSPIVGKRKQAKYCSDSCANTFRTRKHRGKKRKTSQLDYYRNHPLKQKLRGIRHRAKKIGVDFDLSILDLEIPEFCPVLGIKLEAHKGKGPQASSPSVDRIDSTLGYVKGNIRVISNRANTLKNNMTLDESFLIYQDMLRINENGKLG